MSTAKISQARLEHRTGTGMRRGQELKLGLNLDGNIKVVLVIPEFNCKTKFWESRQLVWSSESGASRVDEFWGGTSAGVWWGVFRTSQDLSSKGHVSVMVCNILQTRKRRCVIWSLIKQRLSIDHGGSSCSHDMISMSCCPVLVRIVVHEGHNQ